MPKVKRVVSRRELLELVAATGAVALLPTAARSEGTAPSGAEGQGVPVGDDAELIGALLWSAFAEGAGIKSIPGEVNKKGRELSEGPIRDHLKDGLENFPLDLTVKCSLEAGKKARDLAGGPAAPITSANFEDAWKHIHHKQVEKMKRLAKKGAVRMLGGAC